MDLLAGIQAGHRGRNAGWIFIPALVPFRISHARLHGPSRQGGGGTGHGKRPGAGDLPRVHAHSGTGRRRVGTSN